MSNNDLKVYWLPEKPTKNDIITIIVEGDDKINYNSKLYWGLNNWTILAYDYIKNNKPKNSEIKTNSVLTSFELVKKQKIVKIGPFEDEKDDIKSINFAISYDEKNWNSNYGKNWNILIYQATKNNLENNDFVPNQVIEETVDNNSDKLLNLFDKLSVIHQFYNDSFLDLAEFKGSEFLNNKLDFIVKQMAEYEILRDEILNDNKPLNIAVVGNFSTGKSTFINSLIGDDILGMQIQPSTAKITHLRFGEKFKIKKVLKKGESKIIDLQDYQKLSIHDDVEKKKNKIEELVNISHFEIFIDKPILNKINIFDTPGFSSTESSDDTLTKEWIKKADLLLWLIDINEGGKEDEIKNFNSIPDIDKIIILNKADLKTPNERLKIQNNLSNNFNVENLLHAAKPILENEISFNKNSKSIKELNEIVSKLVIENEKFTIDYNDNEIVLNKSNKEQIKFERVRSKSQERLKDLYSYHDNIYEKFENIKEKKHIYQENILFSKLFNLTKNEWDTLIEIKKEILKKRSSIEKDTEFILNKLKKQIDLIKSKSEAEYKNFRTKLFNKIYNSIFSLKKEQGGFFSDGNQKIIFKKDNFLAKEFLDIIQYENEKFIKFVTDLAQNLLDEVSLKLGEEYELKVLNYIIFKISDASSFSIIALLKAYFLILNEDTKFNIKFDLEKELKEQIDYAIADEEVYDITLVFLQEIYDDKIFIIERDKNESLKKIDYILDNLKKIGI